MCMVFYMPVFLSTMCEPYAHRSTGVTGGGEQLCRDWELNLGPLEEQSVLLTSEPSLHTLKEIFLKATQNMTASAFPLPSSIPKAMGVPSLFLLLSLR